MTRIWLVNWHFQSRITLWCRHKSTNVSMGLCWQMPKFIVWRLWSIYFDHYLPLKPSIGKQRKQSCTPNILYFSTYCLFSISFQYIFFYSKPRYTLPLHLGKEILINTPAAYKYLDIGISVGLVSHVEIATDDTRDNWIIASSNMEGIHQQMRGYWAVPALVCNFAIIPNYLKSECGIL